MPSVKIVKEGDTVILKKESNSKIIKITKDKVVNLWKEKFKLNNLVGAVVGSCFNVDRGCLVKLTLEEINSQMNRSEDNDVDNVNDEASNVSNDNRNLVDDKTNQKLTKEEIQEMRKMGFGGEAIVDNLIVNSSTFSKKTEYSKQKYVTKKSKKHVTIFTVLECNTRNLLDMYHCKGPTKICNLRMDSLSQILSHANVHSGGRYLVVDACLGILLGSIIERLNGNGLVINLYTGSAPSRPATNLSYQFNEQQLKVMHDYPLNNVYMLQQLNTQAVRTGDKVISPSQSCKHTDDNSITDNSTNNTDQIATSGITACTSNDNKDFDSDENISNDNNDDFDAVCNKKNGHKKAKSEPRLTKEERDKRRKERQENINKVKLIIENNLFDGLIIAARMYITPLLQHLLQYINHSRPFVAFCPYKEILMDSYMFLKDTDQVVLLKLFESWLRSYQILPERCHPHVNMSGSGGYLLTGMTVGK